MSGIDWILIVLIAAAVVLALRSMRRHKGCSCGPGCSGSCAACTQSCARRAEKQK